MMFQAMHTTQSLRSTVKELHNAFVDGVSLISVLMENHEEDRVYYSIAVARLPCADPARDIRIVHDIGGDADTAGDIFRQITSGLVTPCTLEDVLSDLLAADSTL